MTKKIAANVILACLLSLQSGCSLGNLIDTPASCSDPLDYYNELSTQIDKQLATTEATTLPVKNDTEACFKLQKAIWLSMPGSKQQNDKKALVILKQLKHSGALSESDQRFHNMLLQHVSQRQNLRNMIGSQDQRLKKTETQLDQLKDIEVEIDKKERSVIGTPTTLY